VEVDARYICRMLNNPNIALSTSLNRWIVSILTFHFELCHVPGKLHGPDGLSRRPPQPGDISKEEDTLENFDIWINNLYGFIHLLNPLVPKSESAQLLCAFATEQASTAPHETTDSEREEPALGYHLVPHKDTAIATDKHLEMAHDWLNSLERPDKTPDHELLLVIHYAAGFFANSNILWKRNPQGAHKRVLYGNQRTEVMIAAHNDLGYRGYFAIHTLIVEQYWWPFMGRNIGWYVHTCHICQLQQMRQIAIPSIVATPAPLFAKIYMDMMHLMCSGSFSYIIQGRCSLTHYPEFWMLRKETTQVIGDWIH
jgi:Integrase zinc binding domain